MSTIDPTSLHPAAVSAECTLGALRISATPAGVRTIEFLDVQSDSVDQTNSVDRRESLDHSESTLPAAPVPPEWIDAIVARVEDPFAGVAEVPLDPDGTPYQRSVWRRLQQIPIGSTTTYSALAQSLGRTDGARAVGAACAANHLAVLIPCHRVLGAGGQWCGYRWGIERKKALLRREGVPIAAEPPRQLTLDGIIR